MKKLFIIVYVVIVSMLLSVGAFATTATVSVGSSTNPAIGSTISIPVNLAYSDLRGFGLYLVYDLDVLTYTGPTSYPALSTAAPANGNAAFVNVGLGLSVTVQPAFNRMYITWGQFSGGINFSGLVLDLQFTYNGGVSTLVFDPALSSIRDHSNTNVLTSGGITNGSVSGPYIDITSANSANWNLNTTWNGIGSLPQPTPGHNVTVTTGNTVTITASAICNNLTIQAGGTLVVNTGQTLKVKGNILIQSDVTGTGNFVNYGTVSIVGTSTVQRYMSGGHYHYVSSPVASGSYSILQTGNTADNFFEWSEPTYLWVTHFSGSGTLTRGKGYAVQYNGGATTKTFTGGALNDGNISIPITYTTTVTVAAGDKYYNLIGDPYPCSLNASAFLTSNSSYIGACYFWDENNNIFSHSDYATYNLTGGIAASHSDGTPPVTGYTPDGYIASGQSFFVRAASAGSVQFTNAMRVNNTGHFYKSGDGISRYWLNLSGASDWNQTLIGFPPQATNGFDTLYDAPKYQGNSYIALYSLLNNEPYAIQGLAPLSGNVTIPIGLYAGNTGSYTFETGNFENIPSNYSVTLEDVDNNQTVNILTSPYTFSINTIGNIDNRFLLHFSIITEVNHLNDNKFNIYSNDGSVYVTSGKPFSGKVEVLNLLGQVVVSTAAVNSTLSKIDMNNVSGCYMVKLTTNGNVFTQKVFIR
ncbi:MAG: T9SS type A sorting domain-containing protein [Bacteroidia bacterium]|nr:T9SS type A sorting domain-containing protein [Bacteroidia bacterium]